MSVKKQSKLLYMITKSEIGGAQGNVYDLISNFHKDYKVHLATGSYGSLTKDVSLLGVPVHLIQNLTRDIKLFGLFPTFGDLMPRSKYVKHEN